MSLYVYGIIHSTHPISVDGMTGVGAQAPALRAVRCGDLAAVVSDAPDELRLRAKRRDLEAHHRIVDALWRATTVLPMRFGTLARHERAIRTELESGAGRYRDLLARLEGKAELNVKAVHRTDAVLGDLLREHRPLRDRSQALRAKDGGTYAEKVTFGEQMAAAMTDRRARDARLLVHTLQPHAFDACLGAEAGGCFVNASFLVGAAARDAFDAALAELRRTISGFADVRVVGPLAPYSFVSPTPTSEGRPWVS